MYINKLIINVDKNATININGTSYPKMEVPIQRYTNPCENCFNNPMNNPYASGFCNCALPYLTNPTY